MSSELRAELGAGDPTLAARVQSVLREIEVGEDLTPRLSRDVEVAFVPSAQRRTGGGRDRDTDAVLAHDGLHHLHLGVDTGAPFVERTRELLFVAFRDADAFAVGIYPHGAWGRLELLQRMVRNWPQAELLLQAEGVIGVTRHYTDDERWRMIKAGVTIIVEIDGKAYTPRFGQTTAGTPSEVTRRVNAFMWELRYLDEQGLDDRLRTHGADPSGYWNAAVRDEQVGLESAQGFLPLLRFA